MKTLVYNSDQRPSPRRLQSDRWSVDHRTVGSRTVHVQGTGTTWYCSYRDADDNDGDHVNTMRVIIRIMIMIMEIVMVVVLLVGLAGSSLSRPQRSSCRPPDLQPPVGHHSRARDNFTCQILN